MNKEPKFFICKHCGNIIEKVVDSGVLTVCCGEEMEELVANTVDAAKEKHVPSVTIEDNIVRVEVGEVLHPMEEKHYIMWIYLHTKKGIQRKDLQPGQEPKAVFALGDDEVIAVYEYCNLHGLWKKDIV
ncbi:desulfoferrodoxin family protein [Herbinix luporum]|uniref:desulfoferrodoxin family protein n=1 Tax=Herbinix luporum TaxID=1679721 RepID=UPI0023F5813A|nr:desulfoferrodoxin family protein [Herbinix luporum]